MRASSTGFGDGYRSSIFTIDTDKPNPFDLFVVSSAEKLSEDIEATVPPVQQIRD
ncbi:MAG: hypothetical protein R3A80_13115 [Bdellovibrionota bacterium]